LRVRQPVKDRRGCERGGHRHQHEHGKKFKKKQK